MNENEIKIFENEEFGQVRVIEQNGELWFCGKDVAEALGYADTNKALAQHCKDPWVAFCLVGVQTGIKADGTPSVQQVRTKFIGEPNLYRLITHSKLPAAEKFESWVFEEVLPSIRKHGGYLTQEKLEEALRDPDTLIKLATELKEERIKREALEMENAQHKQLIAEFNPKASYYDVVLQTPDVISVTQIAKDYGKSAIWLNQVLHELGIQFKQGGMWLLYQKYAEQGYTKSKTETFSGSDGKQHSKIHTYWTQKGRLFIYELLKSNGILPLIECNAVIEKEAI